MLVVGDISAYMGVYAAGLFLLLMGRLTRSESRALMLGIIFAVLAPNPASLIVAGVLILVTKPLDLVRL